MQLLWASQEDDSETRMRMLLLYAEMSTGNTGGGWDVRWGGKETKGREPHKPVTTVDKWSLMPLGTLRKSLEHDSGTPVKR